MLNYCEWQVEKENKRESEVDEEEWNVKKQAKPKEVRARERIREREGKTQVTC